MRTTVDIDAYLLKLLRSEARRQGVSLKEMLNRLLRQALQGKQVPRSRYRCPTYSMGQPLRMLDKALALADSLEDEEISRELSLRK
ncbi:MAG: hypothetical protein KatS3mg081_2470 [Gemmatimonadales bacterium]|nr:hypothetical protein HRbin33_01509 [bacterium HR33]GIW53115.1 MAG: hypothetical protein KatS3mg081_2470 [Gemmatimonadales bacterium]